MMEASSYSRGRFTGAVRPLEEVAINRNIFGCCPKDYKTYSRSSAGSREGYSCPTRLPQGVSEHFNFELGIIKRGTQLLGGRTQVGKEWLMLRWRTFGKVVKNRKQR